MKIGKLSWIFAVALVALAVIGARSLIKDVAGKKHGPLISYSSFYGGGMAGDSRSLQVQKADKEHALISYSHADSHNLDNTVEEYLVPISLLAQLEDVYDSNRLYLLPDMPEKKVFALDAGSDSYTFVFDGTGSVHFSDNQQIPFKSWDVIRELETGIRLACEQGQKLPGLISSGAMRTDCEYAPVPQDQCQLQVYEYRRNVLHYRLRMGLDVPVAQHDEAVLYALDGDVECELCRSGSGVSLTLSPGFDHEDFMELTGDFSPRATIV